MHYQPLTSSLIPLFDQFKDAKTVPSLAMFFFVASEGHVETQASRL